MAVTATQIHSHPGIFYFKANTLHKDYHHYKHMLGRVHENVGDTYTDF